MRNYLKLLLSELGQVFRGWLGEQIRGEHGGFLHISFDFHLSLKLHNIYLEEGHLWVELSFGESEVVLVNHGEGGGGIGGSSLGDATVAVLEVDLPADSNWSTLGLQDLEVVHCV